MEKAELRKKYSLLRAQLNQEKIDDLSLQIANKLLRLAIWDKNTFHIFLSIKEKKEVDTLPLLNILQGKDKEIVISKSDFKKYEMKNFLLTDSTRILKNEYNIPEPADGIEVKAVKIDVVFVPLLTFDLKGNRIGYGKGFYDRFLATCRPDVIKIGLSFFEAETKINQNEKTDIKLDFCVTPNKIYHF